MKLFKIGKIVSIGKTYVILESNYTGFIVYVAQPEQFEKDKNIKLYIYEHRSEYTSAMYGFKTFQERILFEDLLSVSGIGPKTALSLLKLGHENVINYIQLGDHESLSSVPSVGIKTANQIVFELNAKYQNLKIKASGKHLPIEVVNPLKTLGFNQKQIDYAVGELKPADNIETLVENAIRLISNAKPAQT